MAGAEDGEGGEDGARGDANAASRPEKEDAKNAKNDKKDEDKEKAGADSKSTNKKKESTKKTKKKKKKGGQSGGATTPYGGLWSLLEPSNLVFAVCVNLPCVVLLHAVLPVLAAVHFLLLAYRQSRHGKACFKVGTTGRVAMERRVSR